MQLLHNNNPESADQEHTSRDDIAVPFIAKGAGAYSLKLQYLKKVEREFSFMEMAGDFHRASFDDVHMSNH